MASVTSKPRPAVVAVCSATTRLIQPTPSALPQADQDLRQRAGQDDLPDQPEPPSPQERADSTSRSSTLRMPWKTLM